MSIDPFSFIFVEFIRKIADKLSAFLNHPDRYEEQERRMHEEIAQIRKWRHED